MSDVLALRGITKHFGDTLAVDDLDLTVAAGSILGLVGPNGAGKTTALSVAVGLLRPDRGTVTVCGTADRYRAASLVGALPAGLPLPGRLTGRELLTYLGLLRGLDAEEVASRTDELLRVLDLTHGDRTLVVDYSTGMTKKLALAAALLHNPRLLVLDEPLEAVDPVSAATIRALLVRYAAAGGAVIWSSHVMALVETLCDHVAVMDRGRLVACGTTEEVRAGRTLEESFATLVGADVDPTGLAWLGP
ncbi:ABC transporter ATP-binding protein [Actinomycetospora sp. NBRC 106378]|uniref:ABC transporter ATP-binding protein n=1 Tax=Actinomycetospora sp. NBRC 106378 TaxID=3032208 RepID=UPI0024A35803|nr:ABC transporter ATP-binding protein [Actinomycetospora sp. NBRC 106378]GLZ52787.1 ABC transporter ATP-binding protein [Actinomycetospora sp. NBRC 106378]